MRYFFNVHDGVDKLDATGVECANDMAAWHQTTVACAEMLHDIDGDLKPGDTLQMEVSDETGQTCFMLDIKTSGSLRQ